MNTPAMPGRSVTWREWLDEYDPVEVVFRGEVYHGIRLILRTLCDTKNQSGTAIGDEWRADNGHWLMRGKAVERATDTNAR